MVNFPAYLEFDWNQRVLTALIEKPASNALTTTRLSRKSHIKIG